MKRKKKIHSGVCITDERIVCVTGHIEDKTLVLTDALEMKRSGNIDEDITKFIEIHDLDEGAYSIVSDIETQMHVAPYDPHDFDMQEFIKNDVEEYFNFEGFPNGCVSQRISKTSLPYVYGSGRTSFVRIIKARNTRYICSSRCYRLLA